MLQTTAYDYNTQKYLTLSNLSFQFRIKHVDHTLTPLVLEVNKEIKTRTLEHP